MDITAELVKKLEQIKIVPVIKLDDVSKARRLARALSDGGINCAEVTFRAAGADRVIADMLLECPNMLVGAGTVLSTAQADSAINAGAKFLVAPGYNPRVAAHVLKRGVPFMPGVFTPSEIEAALEAGIKYVKLFPAGQAGGIDYIKAVSAPYSDVRFMPTGGVSESNILSYLASSKVFACGGSFMVTSELINGDKWDEITRICRTTVETIKGLK